jgi:hypothetical protein
MLILRVRRTKMVQMIAEAHEKQRSCFSLYMLVPGVACPFDVFLCDQCVCFWCLFWCKTCQLLQLGCSVILYLWYENFSVWGSGVGLLCLLVTWLINVYKCVLHK